MELVAPAGNLDKLRTAFAFGADAVYCGVPDFSLRVRINQFDFASVKEAIQLAHSLGKKIYITLNIFAHNGHLPELEKHVIGLKELAPDGFIVSDPGIFSILKNNCPGVKIHLSTQANCTNWRAAKFWHELGASRIILGREVTLAEVKEIHEKVPGVELEYFVHGAMCLSYSGRCLLSKYYTDRSANLGDCTQPCRWKYKVKREKVKVEETAEIVEENRPDELLQLEEDEHGSYIMNSKDLCLVEYLSELKDAGVSAVKIEGRAKSVYYVGNTTKVYRSAIDDLMRAPIHDNQYYLAELKKAQNRGFTTGFLFGSDKCEQKIDACHERCEWEFCGQITNYGLHTDVRITDLYGCTDCIRTIKELQKNNKKLIAVNVHNSIHVGDEVEFVVPTGENRKEIVNGMFDENGAEITEAHGGQGKLIWLAAGNDLPEKTLVRRTIR